MTCRSPIALRPAGLARLSACTGLALLLAAVCSRPAAVGQAAGTGMVGGDPGPLLDTYLTGLAGLGFSGAVVVAADGEIVLEKGYGRAERETGRPVTPATVFTVGSITKQFTAAAILKLEMMGRLGTDDPITRWFDEVPPDKRGITLHHLLTHSAGFPGAIGDDFDIDLDSAAFARRALAGELLFEPGEAYEYSNVGYSLLGIVVEKASGQPYETFLREQLFTPAGMTRTGCLLPAYTDDELAVGYRDGERWGNVIRRPMRPDGPSWHLRANGGIHATVGDMFRWYRALQGEAILSAEAKEKLFTPWIAEGGGGSYYGYGWSIVPDYLGTRLITHNGGNGIFTADFRWFPDRGIMIFAACNQSRWAPVDYVTRDLSRLAFGLTVHLAPETIELDPAELVRFAGTYEMGGGLTLEVRAQEGSLLCRASEGPVLEMLAGGPGAEDVDRHYFQDLSEDILRRAQAGDFSGFQEAYGEGMTQEQAEAAEGGWIAMRRQQFGAFRSLRTILARRSGGLIHVYLQLDYERGSGYVELAWQLVEIRLAGVGLIRDIPGREVTVYPVAPAEFISFTLGYSGHVRVIFETAPGEAVPTAVTLKTDDGEISLTRIR